MVACITSKAAVLVYSKATVLKKSYSEKIPAKIVVVAPFF